MSASQKSIHEVVRDWVSQRPSNPSELRDVMKRDISSTDEQKIKRALRSALLFTDFSESTTTEDEYYAFLQEVERQIPNKPEEVGLCIAHHLVVNRTIVLHKVARLERFYDLVVSCERQRN